ncbi:MAG: hypothetical protein GF308_17440 [Candidatus Heimdallarchaeota archaeon]|nr:hypothetical protein [Candidatus Heimdallarchaeota archaeon]
MPPRCPNCKGKMEYEPPYYVCTSCGLTVNRHEFDKTKRKHFGGGRRYDEDPDYEQKQEREDYLKWWLSSKKEEEDD